MRLRMSIFLLAMLAVSQACAQPGDVTREIAPTGRLRVAMIGSNPVLVTPYADGQPGGVSVDLGQFLARQLGVPLVPVVYANPASYQDSLGKGAWDIGIGPRRAADIGRVDFSSAFMFVDNMFVAAPGHRFDDGTQVDQPGVRIAVAKDGVPDVFLSRTLKSATLVRVPGRLGDALEVLRSAKADVYGSNGPFVFAIAASLQDATVVPGAFTSVAMAVSVPSDRSAEARSRVFELVDEAIAGGVPARSIAAYGLTGVRPAGQ